MKKTTEQAVRELGGVWPEKSGGSVIAAGWNGSNNDRPPDFIVIRDGSSCHDLTRPEFESTAARMGYPRVTLRPGDHVIYEDVSEAMHQADVSAAIRSAGGDVRIVAHEDSASICWGDNEVRSLTPAQVLNAVNVQTTPNAETRAAMAELEWHERGELPPSGIYCEKRRRGEWIKVYIVGTDGDGYCVFDTGEDYNGSKDPESFRPLRTDRESWVEHALSAVKCSNSYQLGEVYDALKSGTLPTPGVDQ